MQWKQWEDDQGVCYNSGPYTITQRDGGQWLLEGRGLHERRGDPDLLKMIADDDAQRRSRTSSIIGVLEAPSSPQRVDTSEYALDLNELQRTVKRMSKVAHAVNPYVDRTVGTSRDILTEVALELQRIIERLP